MPIPVAPAAKQIKAPIKPPKIATLLALWVFGCRKLTSVPEVGDFGVFFLKGQILILIKNGRILYSYY
jgi:hypothetical protein